MDSLNLGLLSAKLLENIADYQRIFSLNMANGFGAKSDPLFTVLNIVEKVPLIRELSTPVVQPGRTGSTNFTNNAVAYKERWGQLRPFKVDLKLDEKTIYAWSKTYLAKRKPTDPSDIYSMPALDMYMGAIMKQIGKDFNSILYSGVYNLAGTGFNDVADGLQIQLQQGYATSGTGFVGDIPASNMTTSAATITQANILTEINNLAMAILTGLDVPQEEDGTLCIDPLLYALMVNAVAAQLSNGSQVVYRDGADFRLSVLPNTVIKPKSWLKGTSKLLWTVNGNFFWLSPETSADVASIDIEKGERTIKIFIDGEVGFNYGDGRMTFMNSK